LHLALIVRFVVLIIVKILILLGIQVRNFCLRILPFMKRDDQSWGVFFTRTVVREYYEQD